MSYTISSADKRLTPVLFRVYRDSNQGEEVTAIFPTISGNGQSGVMAAYTMKDKRCIRTKAWYGETKLSTPDQYAALKAELERRGYKFRVYRVLTLRMDRDRRTKSAQTWI